MKMYITYFLKILEHKWFVFRGGLLVKGIPLWRLIIHDWSKFSVWEFPRYARNFYGDYSKSAVDRETITEEFAVGWLHHENLNPHHAGYWIPRTGQFAGEPLYMPKTFVREMVADHLGASRAYTGSWNMTRWMTDNLNRIMEHMHPESVEYLYEVFYEIGYQRVGDKWEMFR
jgi:hypothetical protein